MGLKKPRWVTKNNKIAYYVKSIARQVLPACFFKNRLQKLSDIAINEKTYLLQRVNYYNKLNKFIILKDAVALKDVQLFKSPKAYNFDLYEYARYFNRNFKIRYFPGDVNHIEPLPTIQKSRSLTILPNDNAILLKLDKNRHFVFLKDNIAFEDKKDMLIGRGAITQPHRIKFMELYFGDPLCDLGQVNKSGGNPLWLKPKLSIAKHLEYKFILSLEGNDVATNLKWIMSSNSIAVMPKPKYETWFMEGTLLPDYHYILIKDDFSDLHERLDYFIKHPGKALAIIKNANDFAARFFDEKREDLISLLVLQKYFYYTGQSNKYALI